MLNARDLGWAGTSPGDGQWILRVTEDPHYAAPLRHRACLLALKPLDAPPDGFPVTLDPDKNATKYANDFPVLRIPPDLEYLGDGDVIRLRHDGNLSVLFRRSATSNALLVTQRCNSFCIMCSQPPRKGDDSYIAEELAEAIPLFDRGAKEIGITGGEPTLLGQKFLDLVSLLKSWLPDTAVHVLTNGRTLADMTLAKGIADIKHPDLMLGIPLYSDIPSDHDFIVQAKGAYDETLRGIINAKRCGLRVELRVVIHRHNYEALPRLARFIGRNLQFVDHVALMGLEPIGFAKTNFDELFIDPVDYEDQLRDAVLRLRRAAVRVSIYNHQLCVLPASLRSYAVQSISDWKREYLSVCSECSQVGDCAGFFSSSLESPSRGISVI